MKYVWHEKEPDTDKAEELNLHRRDLRGPFEDLEAAIEHAKKHKKEDEAIYVGITPEQEIRLADIQWREELRRSVRLLYDLQKLRIQTGNRAGSDTVVLSELAKTAHETRSERLAQLEKAEIALVKKLCKTHPMWSWFEEQRGVGPMMAGVILSEVDIHRAETVSALWSFAGLAVVEGKAPRPKKGEKLKYNAFLRTKVVGVLADCFIKLSSPWRSFYDDYKHRKQHTLVDCMACARAGDVRPGCSNCKGKGRGPWGESDGHRHRAAIRYMSKKFLQAMWIEWRTRCNLPVPPPYAEVYLNRVHGDHGGASPNP